MAYIFARTERKLEWYCKIKDNDLSFWADEFVCFWVEELMNFRVCEFLSLWVCVFLSWWAFEFVSSWVCEFVSLWVCEFVSLWVCEFVSLGIDVFGSCWLFVSLKANALTCTLPPQLKETLNVKTTLHKETGLPRIHNPKTPYIYTRVYAWEKSYIATRPHPTLPRAKT